MTSAVGWNFRVLYE